MPSTRCCCFLVLETMTGALWKSAAVAALFACIRHVNRWYGYQNAGCPELRCSGCSPGGHTCVSTGRQAWGSTLRSCCPSPWGCCKAMLVTLPFVLFPHGSWPLKPWILSGRESGSGGPARDPAGMKRRFASLALKRSRSWPLVHLERYHIRMPEQLGSDRLHHMIPLATRMQIVIYPSWNVWKGLAVKLAIFLPYRLVYQA